MSHQINNVNKVKEIIKLIEILQLKITLTKMKNSKEMLSSKFQQTLKKESMNSKIGQLGYSVWGTKRKKELRKLNRALGHHQANKSPRRRGEDGEDILNNNGRKLPKFYEIYESTYPRS